MRLAVLAALMLSACACASAPEHYDYDGPGMRPPNPTFRPELDAPHTRGQPGAIDPDRPTLPPGKDKRPVVPRKDGRPQMAAGDEPHLVRTLKPPGCDAEVWETCETRLAAFLAAPTNLSSEVMRALTTLTDRKAACIRERVMFTCVMDLSGKGDDDDAGSILATRERMQKFSDAMDRRIRLACDGVDGAKGTDVHLVIRTLQSWGSLTRWGRRQLPQ